MLNAVVCIVSFIVALKVLKKAITHRQFFKIKADYRYVGFKVTDVCVCVCGCVCVCVCVCEQCRQPNFHIQFLFLVVYFRPMTA
jgi:hypothetical protein